MPYFNGTGPQGKRPHTGRGMGPCSDKESQSAPKGFLGRLGLGRNRGAGLGTGRRQAPQAQNQRQALEQRAAALKQELDNIEEDLKEME